MKIAKKIIITVLSLALTALVVFGAVELWYMPHYFINKEEVTVDTSEQGKDEIMVMSCNMRYMNHDDVFKKSWFYRADLLMQNIKDNKPAIIGFQEATPPQYDYLTYVLTEYDSVYEKRDDDFMSEATPVFYKKDLFELKDKGSFWLSETPDVMSRDWGAGCYRICSYALLTEKETGKTFVVFNTHLDNVSDEARIKGIGVVQDKIAQFGGYPAVIMGDFNAEEYTETYNSITENFDDVKYLTENPVKSCTFQDFGKELDSDCIDYIMVSKTGFRVNSYDVIDTTYDGAYPSDHFQILSSLTLE